MFVLTIDLPDNLVVQTLLQQKNIPCYCRIGGGGFELLLQSPLPEALGRVTGWDRQMIDDRVPPGGGGTYSHANFGMVSLSKRLDGLFNILDLSFFSGDFGWIPILENGSLSAARSWDTPGYDDVFDNVPLNKKQRQVIEMLKKQGL